MFEIDRFSAYFDSVIFFQQAARKSRHKRLEHVQDLRNRRDAIQQSCQAARASVQRIKQDRGAAQARILALRAKLARRKDRAGKKGKVVPN